jgi:hypothetical protein
MKKILNLCFSLLAPLALFGQNLPPTISNFTATPDWANLSLQISYELADPENDPIEITIQCSDNDGKTYALTNQVPVSGDVGFPVQPGTKTATCDLSALVNIAAPFRVRIIADDKQDFDIQALVNEVDSNRLRANL